MSNIMLKDRSRATLVFGVWLLAVIVTTALSIVVGARWSTMALLIMTAAAPMGVALTLGFGTERSMTTHELLYAVNTDRNGRA